ncbi:MAG TPA: uracil-DNA glycosylase [Candidatus Izemoplasmatales bacterium]|nr:uracil-DNA glycosylase [Candidatus Izemoplasmatales bacterium]
MILNNDWQHILESEIHQPYLKSLLDFVREDYNNNQCYPPKKLIFKSLELTPYHHTKVLILGQDPYHQKGQAMGLAFSVPKGVKIPPSLRNIFKELSSDLNISAPKNGDLTPWAKQGVLLMNALWTVRDGQPLAHKGKGWEKWTDAIIKKLNEKDRPMVFVLWGGYAKSKRKLITNPIHKVIENVHPSPLSAYRGFFGSKPFSSINRFLRKTNQSTIDFKN